MEHDTDSAPPGATSGVVDLQDIALVEWEGSAKASKEVLAPVVDRPISSIKSTNGVSRKELAYPEHDFARDGAPVFMFVNASSGNRRGALYLDSGNAMPETRGRRLTLDVDLPPHMGTGKATVYVYNMKQGSAGNKPGFHHLRRLILDPDSWMEPRTWEIGGGATSSSSNKAASSPPTTAPGTAATSAAPSSAPSVSASSPEAAVAVPSGGDVQISSAVLQQGQEATTSRGTSTASDSCVSKGNHVGGAPGSAATSSTTGAEATSKPSTSSSSNHVPPGSGAGVRLHGNSTEASTATTAKEASSAEIAVHDVRLPPSSRTNGTTIEASPSCSSNVQDGGGVSSSSEGAMTTAKAAPNNNKASTTSNSSSTHANPPRPAQTRIRVIVCGGDGTIPWTCDELRSHDVPMDLLALGIVPFGTGNDFSQSYNWGQFPKYNVLGKNFSQLKADIRSWLTAPDAPHDLFTCEIETQTGGGFAFVSGYNKKGLNDDLMAQHGVRVVENTSSCSSSTSSTSMICTKTVCNYFSMGPESRAGMGMERRRQKSWTANKLMYGVSGATTTLFKSTPRIKDVMESAVEILPDKSKRTIFQLDPNRAGEPYLRRTPSVLALCNTDTMGAGVKMWDRTSRRSAAKNLPPGYLENVPDYETPHQMGDGKADFMVWDSFFRFEMDVMAGTFCGGCFRRTPIIGGGHRLFSTHNPVEFNFKNKDDASYRKKGRVYMEVDGEYFICLFPKKITIRHRETLRVLDNRPPAMAAIKKSRP
ncbi:unnamed protein product [Amoebophrya sp. A25]|nr:unnamed protein product [Amoebophrya sp. A25]|eukprot:GSA25T00012128001.1